jgi:hypothetical protein
LRSETTSICVIGWTNTVAARELPSAVALTITWLTFAHPKGDGAVEGEAVDVDASLLWNRINQDHGRLIKKLLNGANRFDCAVAFAKWSGFKPLQKLLVEQLEKGMAARFIVGLDFYQSEPRVLEKLLVLKRRYALEVLVSVSAGSSTFHPKVYRFDHGDSVSLLIGPVHRVERRFVSAVLRTGRGERAADLSDEGAPGNHAACVHRGGNSRRRAEPLVSRAPCVGGIRRCAPRAVQVRAKC